MKTTYFILVGMLLIVALSCTKDAALDSLSTSQNGAGGSTARFTISGNYLYVVDHTSLKSFDISNPFDPVYKDKTEVGLSIETIFPYKNDLFIGSSSSMYIYSLANPAKPSRVAKADYTITMMACDPVYVKDSVAYAALRVQVDGPCSRGLGNSTLQVYNIKNLNSPKLMRTVSLISPQGLGARGNALYVCERQAGLHVFDISQPYSPVHDSLITGNTFYDVIPYGDILICQVAGGYRLYDIGTNPLAPAYISSIQN